MSKNDKNEIQPSELDGVKITLTKRQLEILQRLVKGFNYLALFEIYC